MSDESKLRGRLLEFADHLEVLASLETPLLAAVWAQKGGSQTRLDWDRRPQGETGRLLDGDAENLTEGGASAIPRGGCEPVLQGQGISLNQVEDDVSEEGYSSR